MLNSITDQERPIARLMAMFIKNTVPHAMLFSGIEGIGKNAVATYLAMAFNCRNKNSDYKSLQPASSDFNNVVCRECSSCKKILSGNHPDFIQINPSGKIIKISSAAKKASENASSANFYESISFHKKAIEHWIIIFGNNFTVYE